MGVPFLRGLVMLEISQYESEHVIGITCTMLVRSIMRGELSSLCLSGHSLKFSIKRVGFSYSIPLMLHFPNVGEDRESDCVEGTEDMWSGWMFDEKGM